MLTEELRLKILTLNLVGFTPAATDPKPANAVTNDGATSLTKNGLVKSGVCKAGLAHKTTH